MKSTESKAIDRKKGCLLVTYITVDEKTRRAIEHPVLEVSITSPHDYVSDVEEALGVANNLGSFFTPKEIDFHGEDVLKRKIAEAVIRHFEVLTAPSGHQYYEECDKAEYERLTVAAQALIAELDNP